MDGDRWLLFLNVRKQSLSFSLFPMTPTNHLLLFYMGGGLIYLVNEIQGQAFLDLTMTKLAKVIPRSDLAYGDKRRLLHGIHSIQASHGNQQQQQQQQYGSTIMVRKQEYVDGRGKGFDI